MIYEIKSGNLSAKIDSLGAQMKSFQKDGKEYIWQGDPAYWEDSAPILFPVVGRLKDSVLTVDGKDYAMPMHGFARDSEMTVTAQTENSVTFTLESDEATKTVYPWDFCFSVTFAIQDETLATRFAIENKSDNLMFFGLGGHPGFSLPMEEGYGYDDYLLKFEKEEPLYSNHVDMEKVEICAEKKDLVLDGGKILPVSRSLFDNEAMIFEDIRSRYVDLVQKDTGKGIRFAYGNFPILAFWSTTAPKEGPFLCMEPWYGMGYRDNEDSKVENKYGMQTLTPGQTFQDEFSITVLS